MASDQSGQGQRIQQPGVSLTQGPASQPHCPHGQPQSLSLCGLLKGEPPFHHTGICMVCLSFEQSMLKKKKKKAKRKKNKKTKKTKTKKKERKKSWGVRGGVVYSQNHVVWTFVLLCFILAWCSYKGPPCGSRTARSIMSSRAALLPALATKETSAGRPPGSRDPATLLSHKPCRHGIRTLCALSF